jgi:hypothetical protein
MHEIMVHRRAPFQGLDLRFLLQPEHHRVRRRVQVEADDVSDLVDQEWSGETLNVSVRHGCRPKACQIRSTLAEEASYRLLHAATRITRGGRRLHLRIAATWPW